MNINEALNILKPGGNDLDSLKAAYRLKCKEWHPDLNPDKPNCQEIMKLVNLAYEFLKENIHKWTCSQRTAERGLDEIFDEILSKIKHFPGLEIEACGTWLWIGGNTKQYKEDLKAAGLHWAPQKSKWYWRPADYRKVSRRVFSMDEIRGLWGSKTIDNEPLEGLSR